MIIKLSKPTAIVLDEAPLSLLTLKFGHDQGDACKYWYQTLEEAGHRFFVPEIADYELRRELIRANKTSSITRLDAFNEAEQGRYLPLTTPSVRLAAQHWANLRTKGKGGASPDALDGDMLIAAQALNLDFITLGLSDLIVATTNVKHLADIIKVAFWKNIG